MKKLIIRYCLPVTLTFICLLTLLLEPYSSQWLGYDRLQVIESNQWWRLFSANLVHLGTWHTLLNLASLWLISLIFRDLLSFKSWLIWFFLLFIANIIGMHLWTPTLNYYVGMSGALYGVIAACALAELRLGVKVSGLLLVLVGIKIFAPQLLGIESEYDNWLGGTVVEESHIIGYLQGLILGLIWPKNKLKTPALSNKLTFTRQKSE